MLRWQLAVTPRACKLSPRDRNISISRWQLPCRLCNGGFNFSLIFFSFISLCIKLVQLERHHHAVRLVIMTCLCVVATSIVYVALTFLASVVMNDRLYAVECVQGLSGALFALKVVLLFAGSFWWVRNRDVHSILDYYAPLPSQWSYWPKKAKQYKLSSTLNHQIIDWIEHHSQIIKTSHIAAIWLFLTKLTTVPPPPNTVVRNRRDRAMRIYVTEAVSDL